LLDGGTIEGRPVEGRKGDGMEEGGSVDGRIMVGIVSSGSASVLPNALVVTVMNVDSDTKEVIKVVPGAEGAVLSGGAAESLVIPTGGNRVGAPGEIDAVTESEEITGVISGVRVMRVLKRLGGAMLFNHCVDPLTTEK
jgi:hypothetical protein